MSLYLCTKFQVSSLILSRFRQGGGVNSPPPPPQNRPLKSPPRLGLTSHCRKGNIFVLKCFMQLTSTNLDGSQRVGSKFFIFCRKEGVTQKVGGSKHGGNFVVIIVIFSDSDEKSSSATVLLSHYLAINFFY